jgi:hypothetical protein
VCPVRGAERVVHVQITAVGELAGELRVVLRLARIKARVLEHVDPLVREQLTETRLHRCHRELRIGPPGPAEVRADGDLGRAALQQQLEGR